MLLRLVLLLVFSSSALASEPDNKFYSNKLLAKVTSENVVILIQVGGFRACKLGDHRAVMINKEWTTWVGCAHEKPHGAFHIKFEHSIIIDLSEEDFQQKNLPNQDDIPAIEPSLNDELGPHLIPPPSALDVLPPAVHKDPL